MTDALPLALPLLLDATVAAMAAAQAPSWEAPLFVGTGTAVPSVDPDSEPDGAHDVVIEVLVGGTVGVAGIEYRVSLDGGGTWGPTLDLGTDESIDVPGAVVVEFDVDALTHGTLDEDDRIEVTTTAAGTYSTTPHTFGWRELAKQSRLPTRVVWVPGDDRTGKAGELGPARFPGRAPRPLGTLYERFTVYLEAREPGTTAVAEDERRQYVAVRGLYDAFHDAIYDAGRGTFTLDEPEWVLDKQTRRAGGALRVTGTIQAMIPDQTGTGIVAPPPIAGAARVEVLDAEETTTTAP